MKEPDDREPPAVEWMRRMRDAFMHAIDEDAMRDLAKTLVDRAKKGDKDAMRLLLTYVMPVPTQTTEHRRLSLQGRVPERNGRPQKRITAEEDGEA